MKLPWHDYSGAVSPLKTTVFISLFVPALWVVYGYSIRYGDFAARPLMETIHQIGLWGLRFLLITLAITPARQLLQWPRLILVRRMLGVAAFTYLLAHFTLYCADQMFDLRKIAGEIVLRIYLTIGFVALLGLAALAATSTDAMIRRLGGRRWQRLHRIVYGIGLLAIIHYCMQSKLDEWEPTIMAGFFAWLMVYRLLPGARRNRVPLSQVTALGVVMGLATAGGEALYFWLTMRIDPLRVLEANLTLATGVRPSWVVLAAGLAVAAAVAFRSLVKARARLRPRFA